MPNAPRYVRSELCCDCELSQRLPRYSRCEYCLSQRREERRMERRRNCGPRNADLNPARPGLIPLKPNLNAKGRAQRSLLRKIERELRAKYKPT